MSKNSCTESYARSIIDHVNKCHILTPAFHTVGLSTYRFMRVFLLRDLSPREVVRNCAYVMWFIPLWKRDVQKRKNVTIEQNFLTSETFQDMLGLAQSIVLAIKLFGMHFPNVLFDPSRQAFL